MAEVALVSILCRDQVGLVAAIADHLFAQGVNLRDTTFAALGKGAEFTAICELPEGTSAAGLADGLSLVTELEGAEIRVTSYGFDPETGPMGRITHRVEVEGGDQLDLIARIAAIFAQCGANIVRLDAQKLPAAEGGRYVTRFAVWLAPARADACLAAIANTAGSMGLVSRVEPVSP
jgi:glycine cleavage system transcriptional repressor